MQVTLETRSVTQALSHARRLGLQGRLRITRLRRGLGRGIWARLVGPWWRVTIEEVGDGE